MKLTENPLSRGIRMITPVEYVKKMAHLINTLHDDMEILGKDAPPAEHSGWDTNLYKDFMCLHEIYMEILDRQTKHVKEHTQDPRIHCMITY
jgi:hypothetical protein